MRNKKTFYKKRHQSEMYEKRLFKYKCNCAKYCANSTDEIRNNGNTDGKDHVAFIS